MKHILPLILITFLLLIVALLSSGYQLKAANTYNSTVLLVGQSINHTRPQDNLVNNTTGYSYHKANILNYNMTTNNGSSTAALIGKTEVNRLPNPGIAPPGSQSHLIPFHPKNQSTYLADKKRAALGLLNKS
jgi:hypothetical protein